MAASPSGPALVGDDGVARPGATYVEDTAPAWKDRLIALHNELWAGTMSQQEANEYNALVDAYALDRNGHIANVAASPSGSSVTPMAAASVSHYITQTQKPQLKNFWCGPAAAQSTVLAWHSDKGYPTASKKDGQALSQLALSGASYTNAGNGTTGSTDWIDGDMKRAINNWIFYPSTNYIQYTPTSVAALQDHVTIDIDINWMMPSDTIERENNASLHFNNHPLSKRIFHWTTIYGYATSGTTFALQDPGANSPALGSDWDAVAPYFTMSSTKTYNLQKLNGIADRGIVW